MGIVWDHYDRGGSEKLVLLAMADRCNDQGGSLYESVSSIAAKCNLSDKQARRIIHTFIERGLLEVIGNETGGYNKRGRDYQLHLDKIKALTPPAHGSGTPPTDVRGTPPTHGTPPMQGTPPTHVPDPSHRCPSTPPTHGSQSVIDPSLTKELKQQQLPRARPDPADAAQPDPLGPGVVSAVLRRNGCQTANPMNPDVRAIAESGVSREVLLQACDVAREAQPDGFGPRYLLRILERWAAEAAKPPPDLTLAARPHRNRVETRTERYLRKFRPQGATDVIDV